MIMGNNKVKVAIALSTFNGEKYLARQIESVFSQRIQKSVDITLFVRDDGSTDDTRRILKAYEDVGRLVYIEGNNIGVCESFLSLLQYIPSHYDYVALCDQDDAWHEDKLARAIEVLSDADLAVPQLYCSEYIFCDADLNPVGKSALNKSGVTFEKMLFENVCSGNTMVMNQSLHEIVVSLGPSDVYCHDWWVALLASALGEIHYDRHFYSLDYRRIGTNASPTGSSAIKLLKYRLTKFIKNGELENIRAQLQKLLNGERDGLDPEKARTLELFLSRNRLSKAFAGVRLRQTISGEFMLRVLFLFGKL